MERINVIIAGTRTFKNYKLMCTVMKVIREKYPCIQIISGGAKGADKLGELYALKHKIPYTVYEAEWDKYGKKAGFKRNEQMAQIGQVLVLFWNGDSSGSRDMLHLGIQYGLDCNVMMYSYMKFYAGHDILDEIYNDDIPF